MKLNQKSLKNALCLALFAMNLWIPSIVACTINYDPFSSREKVFDYQGGIEETLEWLYSPSPLEQKIEEIEKPEEPLVEEPSPTYLLGEDEFMDEEYLSTHRMTVRKGYDNFLGHCTPHHKDQDNEKEFYSKIYGEDYDLTPEEKAQKQEKERKREELIQKIEEKQKEFDTWRKRAVVFTMVGGVLLTGSSYMINTTPPIRYESYWVGNAYYYPPTPPTTVIASTRAEAHERLLYGVHNATNNGAQYTGRHSIYPQTGSYRNPAHVMGYVTLGCAFVSIGAGAYCMHRAYSSLGELNHLNQELKELDNS